MQIKEITAWCMESILPLYESVGWTNYTVHPDMLKAAHEHSLLILGAYEDDQLIGIIRVVGDGASIVFIQDILVLPTHQRRGIGSALLKDVMARYAGVYQMQLMTEDQPDTIAFYQSLGFQKAQDIGCCAFMKL